MDRTLLFLAALALTACRTKADTGGDTDCHWYRDADADGYGNPNHDTDDCDPGQGWVEDDRDCDDGDDAIHPGAEEHCDGLDEDCDRQGDLGAVDASILYQDADGDGWGDSAVDFAFCEQPEGWVADATDCDDDDAQIHPGAQETCDGRDEDCDGAVDDGLELTWYADADGDGYGDPETSAFTCDLGPGWGFDASDCDDANSAISPAATERCDGYDDDCDGLVDDDDPDVADLATWYLDGDGDGYGLDTAATAACVAPSGYAAFPSDCDDTSAAFHPGAPETDCADPNDYNCDGVTGYVDSDGDGWAACVECDDGDASVYPGAPERCDGVDDDCDGAVDVGAIDADTWYPDADGDGYGAPATALDACTAPSGYSADGRDCDDADEDINPAAEDVCDGVDNDCDGVIDPDPVLLDADGDGTYNCLDSTIYAYDFDDGAWTGWTYVDLGGDNTPRWSMSGGTLHEASDAAHSIAYGPDLGDLYHYTVSAEVMAQGLATNGAALVFGYEASDTYLLARWLDPNDYYGSYANRGRVDLYRCDAGTCSVLATDDGSRDLSQPSGTWISMAVEVDDGQVTVVWDGVELLTADLHSRPIGAAHVGVWTFDNDGGIYYDDFTVTGP